MLKVTVKDGVITRMRPLTFTEEDGGQWCIEARGREFRDPRKTTINPFNIAERMRIYSENRIKYPMKRKNFDPNGERHPELRGKDEYERISWEEALDLVAGEITRIQGTYGKAAVTAYVSSHHNYGLLSYKMGPMPRFYNILGYTQLLDNPDSWEGWHWGSMHTWGWHWRFGQSDCNDMLTEALKHTEQVVYWSVDPNTTAGGYAGQETVIWRQWLRELGIPGIFIDPYCNSTASHMADKWLAPRPGTDAALAEAVAYQWIIDDTYDHWFIENRTVHFDEWKAYLLGETDGIPKSPEWAAGICDIPAHTIKALARVWASKKTMLATGTQYGVGGACRNSFATEWCSLMVHLIAMRGIGSDGVNFWGGTAHGAPLDMSFKSAGYSDVGWDVFGLVAEKSSFPDRNPVTQRVYRIMLPDAILNGHIEWLGEGFCVMYHDQQFKPMQYPEPGPNGAKIKMIHRHGGSFISTMTETNKWVRMYQSPELEFVVMQDCHWQSETKFGDVILPACTNFERNEISEWSQPGGYGNNNINTNHRILMYQQKCIEPLWESRPDYDIYCDLAKRLGTWEEYTEGNDWEDWLVKVFNYTDLPKYTTYEEFKKKGYFIVPSVPEDYKPAVSNKWYYDGRPVDTPDRYNPLLGTDKAHELDTPSGKIEFIRTILREKFPDDEERPPMPRYIPLHEGHESKGIVEKYPIIMMTPHAKFSYHTHQDNKIDWLNDIRQHRVVKNGYAYWAMRINPDDAKERGIKDGDIIMAYNDRGRVLGVALVTERCRPGLLHTYQAGAKYDPLEPGVAGSIDRGGCVNLLSHSKTTSKNAYGMANMSFLVEICKWEG